MSDWRHDEWCATFLDGAPEEECDCVRKTLIGLEAEIERANRALSDSRLESGILQSRCEDHDLKIARQAQQITRLEASRTGLRAEVALARMRLVSVHNSIDRMLAVDYGQFHSIRDYRDAVIEASKPDKAIGSEIIAALEITPEEVAQAVKAVAMTAEAFGEVACEHGHSSNNCDIPGCRHFIMLQENDDA